MDALEELRSNIVENEALSLNLEYRGLKDGWILGVSDGHRTIFDEQSDDLGFLVNWAIETVRGY